MSQTALFLRQQSKPGKRDEVRRVWEKYVEPRAAANAAHEAYCFCYDSSDPDVVSVFQRYTDMAAMQNFLKGAWDADHLNEVGQFVAVPPQITSADLIWAKARERH